MKLPIIRIGNSQGIRLPKAVLEQCGIEESIELAVVGNTITISPNRSVRKGWAQAFLKMHKSGDDQLIDGADGIVNNWDETEWQW